MPPGRTSARSATSSPAACCSCAAALPTKPLTEESARYTSRRHSTCMRTRPNGEAYDAQQQVQTGRHADTHRARHSNCRCARQRRRRNMEAGEADGRFSPNHARPSQRRAPASSHRRARPARAKQPAGGRMARAAALHNREARTTAGWPAPRRPRMQAALQTVAPHPPH